MTNKGTRDSKVYKDLRIFRGLESKDLRIFNNALLGNYGDLRQRAGSMEGCDHVKVWDKIG